MSLFAKRSLTTLVSSNSLECPETRELVISKSMVLETLNDIWKQGGTGSSNRQRMVQQLFKQVGATKSKQDMLIFYFDCGIVGVFHAKISKKSKRVHAKNFNMMQHEELG